MSNDTSLAPELQSLAALGFKMFPLWGTRPIPSHISATPKASRVRWKAAATDDPAQLAAWESDDYMKSTAYGVYTGASGLVVIDIDTKPDADGFKSLDDMGLYVDLMMCETLMVDTPSGGCHIYFKYDGDDIGPSAGVWGPGLDIRGKVSYTVVPGSIVPAGKYTIRDGPQEPAPLPDWLREILVAVKPVKKKTLAPKVSSNAPMPPRRNSSEGEIPQGKLVWILMLVDDIAKAPDGKRDDILNEKAFRIAQAGYLTRDVSWLILEACKDNGYERDHPGVAATKLETIIAKVRGDRNTMLGAH